MPEHTHKHTHWQCVTVTWSCVNPPAHSTWTHTMQSHRRRLMGTPVAMCVVMPNTGRQFITSIRTCLKDCKLYLSKCSAYRFNFRHGQFMGLDWTLDSRRLSWTAGWHRGSGVNGWMVRGKKEERGDQMCFPDKITLVPAPLNQMRYQLAGRRQGAASPPPRAAGGISLCPWIWVCFCGCGCSFEKNRVGKQTST